MFVGADEDDDDKLNENGGGCMADDAGGMLKGIDDGGIFVPDDAGGRNRGLQLKPSFLGGILHGTPSLPGDANIGGGISFWGLQF